MTTDDEQFDEALTAERKAATAAEAPTTDVTESARLKAALLAALENVLIRGKTVKTDDGDVIQVTPEASYMNVALAYLKQYPPESEELPEAKMRSEKLMSFANTVKFPARRKS